MDIKASTPLVLCYKLGYRYKRYLFPCLDFLLHGNASHRIRLTQQANLVFGEFLHDGPAGTLVGLHMHASEGE